jgi:protein gp37
VGDGSAIEWTQATWNPLTGCDRISPSCDHCYALTLAKRLKAMGQPKYQNDGDLRTSGPGFGLAMHPDALTEPLRWRKPRRVFVNSMSDVGHARVSPAFLARVFAVMLAAERHTFQMLTKRPKHLRTVLGRPGFAAQVERLARREYGGGQMPAGNDGWPLPNVWLGTSVEDDEHTWRADELRQAPAAVRFLSLEPLLGPLPSLDLTGIDWVIVGGESGPNFRPLELGWVRDIRDRCLALRIPLFFKQVGGASPKAGGRLLDGRTWDEFPDAPGTDSVNA